MALAEVEPLPDLERGVVVRDAYGEQALGRCLTLIYGSFSRGGNCRNVAGQGPGAMTLTPF